MSDLRRFDKERRDSVLSPLDHDFPVLKNFEPTSSTSSTGLLWEPTPTEVDLILPDTATQVALESIDIGLRRRLGPGCPRHTVADTVSSLSGHNIDFRLSIDTELKDNSLSPSPAATRKYSRPPSSPPLVPLSPKSNVIDLFQRARSPSHPLATSPRWNILSLA